MWIRKSFSHTIIPRFSLIHLPYRDSAQQLVVRRIFQIIAAFAFACPLHAEPGENEMQSYFLSGAAAASGILEGGVIAPAWHAYIRDVPRIDRVQSLILFSSLDRPGAALTTEILDKSLRRTTDMQPTCASRHTAELWLSLVWPECLPRSLCRPGIILPCRFWAVCLQVCPCDGSFSGINILTLCGNYLRINVRHRSLSLQPLPPTGSLWFLITYARQKKKRSLVREGWRVHAPR